MAEVKFTEEKKLKAAPGFPMAVVSLLVTLAGIPMYVLGATWFGADKPAGGVVLAVCIVPVSYTHLGFDSIFIFYFSCKAGCRCFSGCGCYRKFL